MKRILVSIFCLLAFLFFFPAHAESPQLRATLARLAKVDAPYTFAVLGDVRAGDRVYKMNIAQLRRRELLFVVNVGDLIVHTGNREHWRHFWETSRGITAPYFLTPGNHDFDDEKSKKVWLDEVDLPGNELYYSWTTGPDIFVALESFDPDHEFRIEGEQFEWLKRTLDPAKYRHQFVFVHHPLFMWSGASHEGEALDRYPKSRDALHRLFVEKKVRAVFSGHEHTYNRKLKDGIAYIITGGGGSRLYSGFNHSTIVSVDGTHAKLRIIDHNGVMRDEFSLQKQVQ